MKRPSSEVSQLMILIPFFASIVLSFLFYYLQLPSFYLKIINSLLICSTGIGGCGLYLSKGKGYLLRDYLFILFVILFVLGSILWEFFNGIGRPMATIGILGGLVLYLGKKNDKGSFDKVDGLKKEIEWKRYTFIFFLIVTCVGIVFTTFHWPYGKPIILFGGVGLLIVWISRKWKEGLYKGDYEKPENPDYK
jgi:hypothetical protein